MNKLDEELLVLELFREVYKDFPKGRLLKSESPDFILKISVKKSIGIEITRLHDGSLPKNNPGFSVAELNFENLTTTIGNKEEKIKLYRKMKLPELWLIVVADYLNVPKGSHFHEIIQNQKIKTGFNKVFLFDLFEKKIIEILT